MKKTENICPGCGSYLNSDENGNLVCEYCGTQVIYNYKQPNIEKKNQEVDSRVEYKRKFKERQKLQNTRVHKNLSLLTAAKSFGFLISIYLLTIGLSVVNYFITKSLNIESEIAITILVGLFILIILFILSLNFPILILMLIANRRANNSHISKSSERLNRTTRILSFIYIVASVVDVVLLVILLMI